MTWFRAYPDTVWLSPEKPQKITQLAHAFLDAADA